MYRGINSAQTEALTFCVITEILTGFRLICAFSRIRLSSWARISCCFLARSWACLRERRSMIVSLWSLFMWSFKQVEYLKRRQQSRHFSGRVEFLMLERWKEEVEEEDIWVIFDFWFESWFEISDDLSLKSTRFYRTRYEMLRNAR